MNLTTLRLQFLLALLAITHIFSTNSDASTNNAPSVAMAGWAEVNITPPLGIGLGGRGGADTLADKILDPLEGQLIYMKDAHGAGFVVISLDLIGITHDLSERIRASIVRELGVEINLVVVNCSHTHSGPYMIREMIAGMGSAPQIETDYITGLQQKIITAAREAKESLTPVKAEIFEGHSKVAINRRGKNANGARGIIPDPDGPIAGKVWALKLTPLDGEPPALLFSYACHPVIVYGMDFSAVSADFPGVTRAALEEELGEGSHVQFIQGLAGDVRPRVVADLEQHRFRASTRFDLQGAGKELAEDVSAAMKKGGRAIEFDFAGSMDRPFLPRAEPPPKAVFEKMSADAAPFRKSVAQYWLERYSTGQGFAQGDACPVGLIRLSRGEWIAYTAGEPCVEWEPKIIKWLAPKHVVMWGYSQESLSYIPTAEMLPEGGYEVRDSNYNRATTPAAFAPGIDDAIRRSLQR